MLNHCKYLPQALAVAILAMGLAMPAAKADEDRGGKSGEYEDEDRDRPLQPVRVNAQWQLECATCHIAYAPGLLPAESWRKIMGGLNKHFGTDASLDPQDNKEITAFLVSNASKRWSNTTAPLRITETAWFKRKHDEREISPSVWKNPLVKSPANCQACHTLAERGDFNERNIKLPR